MYTNPFILGKLSFELHDYIKTSYTATKARFISKLVTLSLSRTVVIKTSAIVT